MLRLREEARRARLLPALSMTEGWVFARHTPMPGVSPVMQSGTGRAEGTDGGVEASLRRHDRRVFAGQRL